jgi:2-C-methyl-D-erythritol 4-phosphate cytidylyltransferase
MDAVADDPVGGLLAVPLGDTLKAEGAGGRCDRTVPREGLWRALTPQMFRYGVLRRALALSIDRERSVTDEAAAVELLGLRPRLVRGRGDNLKVTHPEDLLLAGAILGVAGHR